MPIYDDVPARYKLPRTIRSSEEIAESLMLRATRDLGVSPTEALRRMLDRECAKAAAILSHVEREKVQEFDAAVGIGLGPVKR